MAVSMRINEAHSGIELVFPDSERPNEALRTAMKEKGFRWHTRGKYWFARQTDERMAFARKLTGVPEKEIPAQKSPKETKAKPRKAKGESLKEENTFAAVYDSIGGCEIRDRSDFSIHDIPRAGVYCKDTNAFFRHIWGDGDDCITVEDLTNASKTGKSCSIWRIRTLDRQEMVGNHLASVNIRTCEDLLNALKKDARSLDESLEGVRVYPSGEKGIEVFSPFVEVKPLSKMPEEWNKRNFTNALLSGQIYMGKVNYRYTDDYAYDAAVGYREGVGINIPLFVRDTVEDWNSTNYLHMGEQEPEKGTCSISFSEHVNSSKTLYFDLNCNIREGKRRAEERAAGIQSYNAMMKASCIQLDGNAIDENKIYFVISLNQNANTGIIGTKSDFVQGSYLLERLQEDYRDLEILSCNEQEIVPDKLYEIANFYDRREYAEPDNRIIDCGNYLQLVTGKGLLELTAEGIGLPHIQESHGEFKTIESARDNLTKLIRGDRRIMFTGLRTSGYAEALDKLNREAERAAAPEKRSGLDSLIAGAQKKAAAQSHGGHEKFADRDR